MDQVVEKKFNFNTIAAICFIALSILLLIFIPSQIDKPLIQLSFGQFNLPPELFPQIIAGCMLALGAWFFYKSFSLEQVNELRNFG